MIKSADFENFKALRSTTLPLSPFTLLVGPNGSGKSTAIQGLLAVRARKLDYPACLSVGTTNTPPITIRLHWELNGDRVTTERSFTPETDEQRRSIIRPTRHIELGGEGEVPPSPQGQAARAERGIANFFFVPQVLAKSVKLAPHATLEPDGAGLAAVLDHLRDTVPERFERLNTELTRWLPEFDRILFSTPDAGMRAIALRTISGGHAIPAADLSDGTLISLGMLCLAYLPHPPAVVCLEEPDRALHPRLLRDLKDALYRLAYPESVGEARSPVQVIATTHNPYFLDLFSDHPEEVVIAQKSGLDATFQRLSDRDDIEEILSGASLGEVWYTGVLGGVPAVP